MRELVDMDIRRVALVDKAANRRTFLLWKREEDKDMSDEKGKKKEEDTPIKKEEEKGLPIEVEAAGLPDGVKQVISSTLRDLNKSISGLAKLMGYGLNMPIEEKKEETVKEDTEEDKKKDAAIEQAIGDLADAVKGISDNIVTKDEVAKMLEEITGKKSEEEKKDEK